MPQAFSIAYGAADRANRTRFLVEEMPERAKGHLYIVASGPDNEVLAALEAIRDTYYHDLARPKTPDPAVSLCAALSTADALLRHREPEGVSCLAAAVREGRLFVAYTGSCGGLITGVDREFESLVREEYANARLGTDAGPQIGQITRALGAGDTVVIWADEQGLGIDAQAVEELATSDERVPELAAVNLLEASDDESLSLIVLTCEEHEVFVKRVASEDPEADDEFVDFEQELSDDELEPATAQTWESSALAEQIRDAVSSVRLPEVPRPVIAAAVIVGLVVVSWLAVSPLQSPGNAAPVSTATPPPTTPATTTTPSPSGDVLARIDKLWLRGDKGDGSVWTEVVYLLEGLPPDQKAQPKIMTKLETAKLNKYYFETMADVDLCWGDPTAASVATWPACIEKLESLYDDVVDTGYARRARNRLYSAYVTFGQALVSAGRSSEAMPLFTRARDLDPSRAEAVEQLRLLNGTVATP